MALHPRLRGQKPRYSAFGHGLYPKVVVRILRLIGGASGDRKPRLKPNEHGAFDRQEVRDEIVRLLPQSSIVTRRAVANKMIQRFLQNDAAPGSNAIREITPTPFVHLGSHISDRKTRLQLLLWQLSRVDTLVGGLARYVFFPYLIQARPPGGWSANEFHVVNGGQLFVIDRFITMPFLEEFATREWGFTSRPTLNLAVRILTLCGRIENRKRRDMRFNPRVSMLSHETTQLVAFIYGIYQEFLPTHTNRDISMKQMMEGRFVRTMLIPPEEVDDLIRRGVKYQFFQKGRQEKKSTRAPSIRLSCHSLDQIVEKMLKLAF
ncbi:MAG: hypothetical protein AUJ92_22070 [Armatimonadetes bacterium CG2_30_59_28]|nr:hypothetical protein [Armatimonadota bacterium]OIO89222.1 MAG: hypothetical protein AUJ92_22070 [Armatimonadetes bacterium CG2_30_59_28]PIU62278.1 MAG: hypothetical protein COS85_18985 [Armatimonadetes bacterium CG07_land_8_20_14_0_80_59_28]PIX39688.1 MAG: hypothetical protein COZ56_16740 [Armatimonadetes bacterium CG_4_8_14_3_um_filter_58_9]PIY44568.1 MAG: hypothetical protein COZ05_07860 [Armatimonadetes bacterium CG_4_10_14_3_um_filter_59_10]